MPSTLFWNPTFGLLSIILHLSLCTECEVVTEGLVDGQTVVFTPFSIYLTFFTKELVIGTDSLLVP